MKNNTGKEDNGKNGRGKLLKKGLTGVFTALLFSLSLSFTASASVSFTKEPTGTAEQVYVAGNPDLYPLESYDPVTGEYEGAVPELLREVSEKTGIDFVYVSCSSENQQLRLGRNLQVDLLTAYTGETGEWCKGEESICTFSRDGKQVDARLCFTSVIPMETYEKIEDALAEISGTEILGWTVSCTAGSARFNARTAVTAAAALLFLTGLILLLLAIRKYSRWKSEKEALLWTDALTGRGNRRYFCGRFDSLVTDRNRSAWYLIYYVFDIEWVNRFAGREMAETLLSAAAAELPEETKQRVVAHTNGRAFAELMEADSIETAVKETEGRLEALNRKAGEILGEYSTEFRAAILPAGLAAFDGRNALLYAADALKQRKDGAVIVCDEESLRRTVENMNLQGQVAKGFEKQEFGLLIQPIGEAGSGKICMGEVLSRWENPVYGRLKPARFLQLVREMNYTEKFDFYMLEKTCALLAEWSREEEKILPLACNFNAATLRMPEFRKRFFEIVDRYSFERSLLHIEITDLREAGGLSPVGTLKELKNSGFCIDLDGFGASGSFFTELEEFAFDIVKLKKELIPALETERGRKMSAGLVELAHAAGCRVAIEGIETERVKEEALRCGCDYIQGYGYAAIMDPEEAIRRYVQSGM